MDAAATEVQTQCCPPSYLMYGLLAYYPALPHTVVEVEQIVNERYIIRRQ